MSLSCQILKDTRQGIETFFGISAVFRDAFLLKGMSISKMSSLGSSECNER